MLGATGLPTPPTTREVSGTLRLLGAELRHHTHAVSAVFYGILDATPPAFVSITASAYKVDVVTGAELWSCFEAHWDPLFDAFRTSNALEVSGMTALSTGALLWDASRAVKGAKFKPLDVARDHLHEVSFGRPSPEDRHPVHLALPIFLEGYTATQDAVEIEGGSVPVERTRVEPDSALGAGLAGTKRCLGLMRFDGGAWRLTPLVATKSKKLMWSVSPPKREGDTVAVLRERASKLLRRKS